jgi:hypothetical protein
VLEQLQAGVTMVFASSLAEAEITPIPKRRAATDLAQAMAFNPKQVTSALFATVPPRGNPAAVSTTPLAGFPRQGRSYAILSSGNALYADDPNTSGNKGAANLGPLLRGARDVVIMRVNLAVPKKANCLSFRFRFLSEEFPEFVHSIYNDAFIAELDTSDWDASRSSPLDPAISAPHNFAFDSAGRPIRVNSVGATSVAPSRAKGTTYHAATRILRASTPITSGRHALCLSIFDQGDRIYDSAVFLDRLTLFRTGSCKPGIVAD